MSERGGYRCCMSNCQSTSNGKRGIKETLFRFPKDAERSKLWVSACGRNDLLSKKPIELYNNYRVCKLHFEKPMFLNFEKTRLQPHAVPKCGIMNNNEAASPSTSNVTRHSIGMQNLECSEVEFLVSNNNEISKINFTVMDAAHLVEEKKSSTMSDVGMQTSLSLSSREKKSSTMSDVGMQTSLSLSSTSPRKIKLQQRIKKYKKRIALLESKMQQLQKMESIESLDRLLDKHYPKQTADFLKIQARLFKKQEKVGKIALYLSNIV